MPWNRTVIYECHVRGLTKLHPAVPEELRGTYLGMASDPVIEHLLSLGVTAVELMPVHHFVRDRVLLEQGLTNYWGYNSIAFLAPDPGYATGGRGPAGVGVQVDGEDAARGGHRGHPRRGLQPHRRGQPPRPHAVAARGRQRGLLPAVTADDQRYYVDFTGTGNSLGMLHPRTVQLIFDSLRYWVLHMHVDGFRFDLAPVLARELYEVNRLGTFFDIMQQDPVLSQVKLIAEPWDVGPGGYQIGNFPVGWAEWNGEYRDAIRRFWRGDNGQLPALASRLSGSSDLYSSSGRRTYASVNFITAHDGYTLNDLVSYEQKHNEANGEGNRDGHNDNISRNWGAEGRDGEPAHPPPPRAHEAQLAGDADLLAGRADADSAATRWAGRSAATTTRTRRTTRSAGSTGTSTPRTASCWSSRAAPSPCSATTRCCAAAPSSRAGRWTSDGGTKDVTWLRPDGSELSTRTGRSPTRTCWAC